MAKIKTQPPPGDTAAAARVEERRAANPETEQRPEPLGRRVRGWADALIFAFVLAMFIRTYVFELYMIPTGSMTPALIGDDDRLVTQMDWDRDGTEDIVVIPPTNYPPYVQVHLRDDQGRFGTQLFLDGPNYELVEKLLAGRARASGRRDMIMVNKFAYWFTPPERGDIAIFKFPHRPERGAIFDPAKPVYIKRTVGRPGESLRVDPPRPFTAHPVGHAGRLSPADFGGTEYILNSNPLLIDGEPVADEPFGRLHHFPIPGHWGHLPDRDPFIVTVGDDEVYMFGDNQMSSSDSRYWGGVPLDHLRGKAILRYLPLPQMGFLDTDK
jgi:signal peptidase I